MFTKDKLETGMIIEMRNGYRHVVMIPNGNTDQGIFMAYGGYMPIQKYTNELMLNKNITYTKYCRPEESEFDIMKVWRCRDYSNLMSMTDTGETSWTEHFCDLVFDRAANFDATNEEPTEMTVAEICEALGKNVRIVKEKRQ